MSHYNDVGIDEVRFIIITVFPKSTQILGLKYCFNALIFTGCNGELTNTIFLGLLLQAELIYSGWGGEKKNKPLNFKYCGEFVRERSWAIRGSLVVSGGCYNDLELR